MDGVTRFVLEDFVDKLIKRLQACVPSLTLGPNEAISLHQCICEEVIKPSAGDLGQLLTSQFAFMTVTIESLKQEYQWLSDREQIDERLKAQLQGCFGRLETFIDPDMLIARIEDSNSNPNETSVNPVLIHDATITREGSPSRDEFKSFKQRKGYIQCQLPGLLHLKSNKPIKKEFFRCQYIRSIKKAIRQMKKRKFPKVCIHRIDRSNHLQVQQWESLTAEFYKYSSALLSVSGSNIHTTENPLPASRSFNDAYCFSFFTQEVRFFHFQYCDFVYQRPVAELCANMKLRCCQSPNHEPKCDKIWKEVHRFVKYGMLMELGFSKERLESESGEKADIDRLADS